LGHLASGRFPHERCVMDEQENVVGARPGAAERPQECGAAALGRGGRMSRPRKTAAVLRLLRGEDLETVSRELGVTAARLTGWHDAFLAAGEAALATRAATGEELASERLKARLGAALIERDLLNEKIAILNDNSAYGKGLADETQKSLHAAGGQERHPQAPEHPRRPRVIDHAVFVRGKAFDVGFYFHVGLLAFIR